MPHPADVRIHATHDLERIAAYAAGDATGADLETASALVAGCAECAALHHDLRLIAAALPAMPPARRTRDFRITPEQAATLRPAGWRRFAGAFAGPRFGFAAPLGTGLATLGLAGLLLGTLAGTPLGTGGAATGAAVESTRNLAIESAAPLPPAPSAAPSAKAQIPVAASDAHGPDAAPTAIPAYNSSGANGGAGTKEFSSPSVMDTGAQAASADPGASTSRVIFDGALTAPTADRLLVMVGGAAFLVGLLLTGLRWASRRLA